MSQQQRNRIAIGFTVVAVIVTALATRGMTDEQQWQMIRASFGGVCSE